MIVQTISMRDGDAISLKQPTAPQIPVETVINGKTMPILDVHLFGGVRVYIGGMPVDAAKFSKTKVRQLLAHLVTRFGREVSREILMANLWPNFDTPRARDNLYVSWSLLRRSIGDVDPLNHYLINNGSLYRINTRLVRSDVEEFDRLARKSVFSNLDKEELGKTFLRMDELYCGDLLSNLTCDDYILRIRDRYRNTYVDSLICSAHNFLAKDEGPLALWFARKAMSIDSTREDVYQTLMVAQGMSGQRTAGMETFFACKSYLDEELGISLSHKTTEIYEKLLNDKY